MKRILFICSLLITSTVFSQATKIIIRDKIGCNGVTSVATNDLTGIKGGTIASSGTLYIDTFIISTRAWRDKLADSLGALINDGVPSDTNSVLYIVLDSTCTIPGSPTTDDAYMVCGSPSGAWAGHAYDIATWDGAAWVFTDPSVGDYAQTTDDGLNYIFNGTLWRRIGGIPLLVGGNRLSATITYGTIDNRAFILKTNNVSRLQFAANGDARFFKLTGAAAGIMGLSTTGVSSNVQGSYGLSITSSLISADTAAMATRARVQKGIDSLGVIIGTKGTGTVTSVAKGIGLVADGTITTTGTINVDTFAISTRLWRNKLGDSLAAKFNAAYTTITSVNDSTYTINRFDGTKDTIQFAAGASGSVTNFSAGDLSPLFTTSVATSTSTPALTFSLTNAAAHKFFGNFTGSTGAPSYSSPALASADFANQGTTTTVLRGNAAGNPSWGDAFTLTTTGTSGAATFSGGTLNIPQYTGATVAGNNTDIQFNDGGAFGGLDSFTYNKTSKLVTIFNSALGIGITSASVAVQLKNSTPAIVSLDQYSPMLDFMGFGWKSNATAASQEGHFAIRNKVLTGAGQASSNLEFLSPTINASTPYVVRMTLTDGGALTTTGNITAGAAGASGVSAASLTAPATLSLISAAGSNITIKNGNNVDMLIFGATGDIALYGGQNQGTNTDQSITFGVFRNATFGAGLATNSAGGTTVTGASTKFLDFFKIGDQITMSGETRTISAIASNTSLTTDTWTNAHSSANFTATAAATGLTAQSNGKVGIGTTTPAAFLDIAAGTTAYAAIRFNSGTDLTTGIDGAVNWDGSNLNIWDGTTKYTLNKSLTGSGTLDFGSTAAGASTDLTITVTGAADGDVVALGTPNGSTTANGCFTAWVSASNTVTVRYTNTNLVSAADPASGTFKIRVIQ